MQTKRVILTIGALLVAGIVLVMLLGREPAVTSASETAATEAAITAAADGTEAATETATPAEDETNTAANTEPAAAAATEAAAAPATEPAAAPATDAAPAADAAKPADETALLSKPSALKIDVDKAMQERTLGKEDAPVTIIEYASMTCPHCAHFANDVLPEVKKQLIETGKAKIIFRDFPLDRVAVKAAAMARCADHDKYFDLVEVIFKNQERWISAENPQQALAQLGTLAGMDADYINACMNDAALESALLQKMQDGQKQFSIEATPTFIFNNGAEKFNGARDVSEYITAVNKLSAGK